MPISPFIPLQFIAADHASVTLYAHGAHIASWTPPGDHDRLFMSPRTVFGEGEAIRGGVPVCFPQFSGRGPLTPHGFARRVPWTIIATAVDPSDAAVPAGTAGAHLQLLPNDYTRAMWDHDFQLDLRFTASGNKLSIMLDVTNTGDQAFDFTAALHTYFHVADISAVVVGGLADVGYNEFGVEYDPTGDDLRIEGEVDRIYWNVPRAITLVEGDHVLTVLGEGFPDAVVWNPGPDKCARLTDMEPDGYKRMLCIESAVIGTPVVLAPGASWCGAQHLAAH